ncbi:hypothetical protein GOODEAATRI_027689 [Goodea atripinnis]|uniref:Uncharacterized protein n=1 Tax=Goodea atripinnis TaxID=208336 RepID=A0ABV0MN64_9TELE
MGIAGIGGLRIHGNAGLQRPAGSRQHRGCSARPLADAAKPGALVSLSSEAIDRADQEADWGGELLAVRLESDPAGAHCITVMVTALLQAALNRFLPS